MRAHAPVPRRAALAALLCLLGALATAGASDGWEIFERTDEGYELARRPVAGRDLPTLRGRGVLKGDIVHLLAILLDAERATQWAEGVSRMKILEHSPPLASLVYSYSDLTWPVSDRDTVNRAELTVVRPGREYRLTMHGEPDAVPRKEGVVRIEHSDARFSLKKRGEAEVWVEYVVDVDPGGSLPTWLVRWASKSVPGETLRKLQRQLDRTRGDYDAQMAKLRALGPGTYGKPH